MTQLPGIESHRPPTRPFVGDHEPVIAAVNRVPRPRPFSVGSSERTTSLTEALAPELPGWSVVQYQPGMNAAWTAPRLDVLPGAIDAMPASLESPAPSVNAPPGSLPAPDGARPGRGDDAASVLDAVADRLRRGEILLAADATLDTEADVVASVLSALLGARR